VVPQQVKFVSFPAGACVSVVLRVRVHVLQRANQHSPSNQTTPNQPPLHHHAASTGSRWAPVKRGAAPYGILVLKDNTPGEPSECAAAQAAGLLCLCLCWHACWVDALAVEGWRRRVTRNASKP
jgi:hypothetical protein